MDYYCEVCKKYYKTYQTLWKHNKNFHKSEVNQKSTLQSTLVNSKSTLTPKSQEHTDDKKHYCKYCNREFNKKQSKSRHEINYCKKSKELTKIQVLEEKLEKLTAIINQKQLPINNINKGNIINNNIINNFRIELGIEDVKLFSEDQKLKVLRSINDGEYPIVTLVDELYKNEINRNIKISNLQNSIALKYDGDIEKFKVTSKRQAINDIISVRKHDIKAFFEEFCNTNKITQKTKVSIEKYLEKLFNTSENNVELRKFLNEHKEQIIIIIYNITLIEEENINKTMEI
jgi:hypothetical protein